MSSPRPTLKPRILLIEDDNGRVQLFEQWLAGTEFVLVRAQSGGVALGMLQKGGHGVAGVLLDHDLSDSPLVASDARLSASDLLPLLVKTIARTAPILIHSHNSSKPVWMERMLTTSGFSVTRIRFAALQQRPEYFQHWLQEVRDNWESEGD